MRISAPAALVLCATLSAAATAADGPDRAAEICDATGVRGGLIVLVGCGDGRLAAELGAREGVLVHGLATSPEDVASARRHVWAQGLYGKVSIDRFDGKNLPYTDGLVNLLVSDDLDKVPMAEVMRVLAPLGVACVRKGGAWTTTVKPWPEGIDQWTHFLHGPDNNAVARDEVVGPPGQVQWTAGPQWSRDHDVTPSVIAPVTAGGRLFYMLDEGPVCVVDPRLPQRHSLVARDAFNGVVLWRRSIADWYSSRVIWGHLPVHSERRLVATKDRVYATLGIEAPVTALDAATGAPVREYEGTEHTSEIVYDSGILALVIRNEQPLDGTLASRDGKRFRPGYPGPKGGGQAVMAVRADSGECLWRVERHAMPLTLAVSGGHAFFVDQENVVCLDLASGKEIWSRPVGRASGPTPSAETADLPSPPRTLVVHGDVVLTATAHSKPARSIEVTAMAAADGRQLWTREGDCLPNFHFFFAPVDLFVARGLVWALAENLEWNTKPGSGNLLGLEPESGEVRARIPLAGAFTTGHHVRCYKGKATDRFLLFNKRGIEFVDIASDAATDQCRWVRGACRYGILPANGLIYTPSHACACYPAAKLDGFYALAPEGKNKQEVKPKAKPRLERGPAYREKSEIGNPKVETNSKSSNLHITASLDSQLSSPSRRTQPAGLKRSSSTLNSQLSTLDPASDWPTYRHDARRSGATAAGVSADLRLAWQADLGGKLSAPVAAGGKVFVAGVDRHTVYCLDAESGRTVWRFTAGARIDSPPTIFQGKALFGCRDGWVYCLRTSDGTLAWRLLAAPAERLVGAFGQLESAWPVHGSVLVRDGIAYFAAGRSSFLEGGIRVFGVDAASGAVRYETTIVGPDGPAAEKVITSGSMPGALPDILAADGPAITMRHVRLDRDLANPLDVAALSWGIKDEWHLLVGSGFLDDSLFNRSTWRYGIRVDRSQMLVLDGKTVYGVRVYSGISWNCPVYHVGDGFLVFRQDVSKPVPKPPQHKQPLLNRIPYERYDWHARVPLRVAAIVLAGSSTKRLFVAGAPDEIEPNEPWAASQGSSSPTGGRLLVLSAATGETLADVKLDAPPVWDGMAATDNRLFLATRDGKLLCMSGAAAHQSRRGGDVR